jgi:hypothetical protein
MEALGKVKCSAECKMEPWVAPGVSPLQAECVKKHEQLHITQCNGDRDACTFCQKKTMTMPTSGGATAKWECCPDSGGFLPTWTSTKYPTDGASECPAYEVTYDCYRDYLKSEKLTPDQKKAVQKWIDDMREVLTSGAGKAYGCTKLLEKISQDSQPNAKPSQQGS